MSKTKFNTMLATMPALHHSPADGSEFDIHKSDVVAWLVRQPEALQRLFQVASESGAMVFDKETRTWKGCSIAAAPSKQPAKTKTNRAEEARAMVLSIMRKRGETLSLGDWNRVVMLNGCYITKTNLYDLLNIMVERGEVSASSSHTPYRLVYKAAPVPVTQPQPQPQPIIES